VTSVTPHEKCTSDPVTGPRWADKREHMRERTWIYVLGLGLAASIAAAAGGESAQGILTIVMGLAAAIVGLVASRHPASGVRRPWLLFTLAAFGFTLAGPLRLLLPALSDRFTDFPSPADAVVGAAYLSLIAGTYLMGSLRSSGRNFAAHLDGLIVAIGAAMIVWTFALWPYMIDSGQPFGERLINAGFAVCTTMLLAATTRLAVGPGARTTSYYLLAGAITLLFITDVTTTLASTSGARSTITLLLAPFIYTLFSAAALHPTMPLMFDPPDETVLRLTRKRIALLGAGLAVAPATLAWTRWSDYDIDVRVVAVGSALLTVVVLARFRLLVRAQEKSVDLQRIQRDANADLAAASTRHAMHRAALRAVVRLAGESSDLRVSMAQVAGRSLRVLDAIGHHAEAAVGTSITMDRVPDGIVDGLAQLSSAAVDGVRPIDLGGTEGKGAVSIFVAPLSAQSDLSGALVVTSRTPITLALRESIETLASTVSLALESATLTENLVRRRSERRFRALVENSSDIVLVVNDERQITFASPAAHRLLGLPEHMLVASHPARWVHPDDWPALSRVLDGSSPVDHGDSGEVEVRIRHVNGSHRWFEIRTRDLRHDPEIEGLVVTAREITDRKATEQRLAANEARFRALVQNSTDVVAVIDESGCFSYVSPAISEMLGYAPEDLVGSPALALIAPEDFGRFQLTYPELSQRLPDGDLHTRRIETQIPHRNGESRTVDITVTDLRHEPAVAGIVLNARDITVRKALERDLRYQALHDTLTGLANRTMFTQQTAAALRADRGPRAPIGALFIDLDDFKTVNDSLGHAVGDQLLQEVSSRLLGSLSSGDLAARLGGDEFAVLVVDATTEEGVVEIADRILQTVAEPFHIHGREIRVTASIGIALAEADDVEAEVLLRSADVAMYLAKDRGKNRQAMFETHMHTSVFERLELKADLVRAIDDGQLRCHYQPIVSLQTGRITGAEALVRWEHPTRGWLTPDAFIPLAEDTGLVVPLGEWVLREACQQLRSWQLHLAATSTLSISVNLSVRQLADDAIIHVVRDALDVAGLDPSTLTLEITETTLMHDTDVTRTRLAQLRDLGVSLAVDDFGTGYSSLQYVQRFPIDIIKIDRSFVTGLGTNPGDGAVVQSMIELSQRLGVHTVAEGIDRPEQVTLLQSLGADLGQGYLFSKPVPASEIDAMLAASPHANPRLLIH
jgi:diguanylate cyclase (GGDEF)-like protein/PAS domain S-box-containing protein